MSENSAFWDGEITGDAASATGWEAPYLSSEKIDILSLLTAGIMSEGFIVPESDEELFVNESSTPAMSVSVAKGTAVVGGRLYINTSSETLTIAANASGNPRIDRIILRTSFAAQTIRLVVLQGTPGATPALPTLTQDANTWEVSLAYIWVANGAATIPNERIHDERQFLLSFEAVNKSFGGFNEIVNSEYMAFTNLAFPIDKPTEWGILSSNQVDEPDTPPSQMSRGWSTKIESSATDATDTCGIYQTIPIKPDTMYAIRALVKTSSGVTTTIDITSNAYAPNSISREILSSGVWEDEIFYYRTEHDATTLTFAFSCPTVLGNIIYCGQVLIIEGYYSGKYREFSEILMADELLLGSLANDLRNTSSVTWDLDTADAGFSGHIPEGVKALLLEISISENIAPTPPDVEMSIRPYGATTVVIRSKIADCFDAASTALTTQEEQGEVYLIDRKFDADYIDNGVTTLSTTMQIQGIRT